MLDLVHSKIAIIRGSMGMTRKIMRFGLEIPIIIGIIKRIKQHNKSPQKMIFIQTLADIFGALYFIFDHPLYFTKTGFLRGWSKELQDRIGWWSEVWWLLQTILEIACHVVAINDMEKEMENLCSEKARILQQQQQFDDKLNKSSDQQFYETNVKKLQELDSEYIQMKQRYSAKVRTLIRLFFDCPTALANMNMVVSEKYGGVCGAVASAISLYDIFGSK